MPKQTPVVFLQPWRSTIFQFLAGIFLFVAVGGFFITNFFEFTVFYQFLVVAHTLLGLVILLPFCYYLVFHGMAQWRIGKALPKLTGVIVSITMSIALASGVGLVLYSARSELQWLVRMHMWSSVAGVTALAVHLVQGYVLLPTMRRFKRRVAAPRALFGAVVPVLVVALVTMTYKHEPYFENVPDGYEFTRFKSDGPYFPSEARTANDRLITLAAVAGSESCGASGCHTGIKKQWSESIHRVSFHEPIYRANELDIVKERGISEARWCASCHEPVVLMSGNLDPTSTLNPKTLTGHPYDSQFEEGISCVACHGIAQNSSLKGVGSYVFGAPDYYIYTARTEPVPQLINKLLIRVKPQPHRDTFLKPVHKDSRACMSCHKEFMDENVNHYRWIGLQNQFDSWRTGPWSNENFLTFRTQPLQKCVDCHMPPEPTEDIAANDGKVRAHRFAGANLAIPYLLGLDDQYKAVEKFKNERRLRVSIAEVQASDDPEFAFHTQPNLDQPLEVTPAPVQPGQTLNVSVVVTNTKIGHRFPTGTNDAKDVWIEFIARDATGRRLFHSGYMGKDGTIDPEAHFYRVVPLDENADWINTRRMWEVRTMAYARTIPPGAADLTTYRFTVPRDAVGPIKLEAHVRYRKVSLPFAKRVAELEPRIYEQPIFTMGETALEIGTDAPIARDVDPTLWREILIDYGIGLFREGNMDFARRAFTAALPMKPGDERVYTDIAMTHFRESEYDLATEWLQKSLAVSPGDARVPWFEGQILSKSGHYAEALEKYEEVAELYPRSDLAWFEIGKMRAWLNDTQGAEDAYERVIDIDPNHAGAYHGLAQTYRQTGNDLEARAMMSAFLRIRKDTETGQWLNQFYAREPWIATTTRPGYIHDRGLKEDPWVAGGAAD